MNAIIAEFVHVHIRTHIFCLVSWVVSRETVS